jgi:GNAT superfamily N-acetyltransferase
VPLQSEIERRSVVQLTPHQLMKLFAHDSLLLFGSAPEFEARITPGSFFVLTGEADAAFNLGGVLAHPRAEEDLQEIGTVIASRHLAAVLLLDSEVAAELAPIAHGLGLHNEGCMPLMVLERSTPPEVGSEYVVKQVRGPDDLARANALSADAFSLPREAVDRVMNGELLGSFGVEAFLAQRGGEPMSSVWTTTLGPVVGIWIMGTPPVHQRQGAGRALLSYVIAEHMSRGATQFYLGATHQGEPLYEGLGFVSVAQPSIWVAGSAEGLRDQREETSSPA